VSQAAETFALDLALPQTDVARLLLAPQMARRRGGRPRPTPLRLVWHDTPATDLAGGGETICEHTLAGKTHWRLERLRGSASAPFPPGAPPPPLAVAADCAALRPGPPEPLLPVAAWDGSVRGLSLDAAAENVQAVLRSGALRAVTGERPSCRLLLSGPPESVTALALALADRIDLRVSADVLASEAYATAGRFVPAPALGAPLLPTQAGVGDAFAHIVAHLAGVMAHWAPRIEPFGGPEAVHQLRVAVRRLLSALRLFRRAVGGPELDAVHADLRALMRVLGPARDWDVFTGGTGQALVEVFADDTAVTRLLSAAERRRRASYAALLDHLAGSPHRVAGIRLTCLAAGRPWERPAAAVPDQQAAALVAPLEEFAAHALKRRLARLAEAGDDLSGLAPEDLHHVRIRAKRLRYAAEFFAPLYARHDTRRFIRRVVAVQEHLGHLNDGAVARGLMAQLTGAGGGYAAGVVRGYVAAGLRGTRAKSVRSWKKLRRAEPFWS
jgi:CHAD domain-containing protein